MIKIPYNNDSWQWVIPWDSSENPTIEPPAVYEITISRRDTGAVLLGPEEIARADKGSLVTDATSGDNTITQGGIESVAQGQSIRIAGTEDGPCEDVVLSHISDDFATITLDRRLIDSHQSNADIWDMYTTHDLDTSDTDVFKLGLDLTVRVVYLGGTVGNTYQESYHPTQFSATVVNFGLVPNDTRERFRALYPDVFEQMEPRYDAIEQEAIDRLRAWLWTKGRNIDLLVDSQVLRPALIEQIYLLAAPRSDEWATERADATGILNEQMQRLEDAPIWFDENQDSIEDDTEIGASTWYPYNRGL